MKKFLNFKANVHAGRQVAMLLRERGPLILAMTRRDIRDRYAGQALGVAWAFLSPLLIMTVYVMAFGLIFKGRIGTGDDAAQVRSYWWAGISIFSVYCTQIVDEYCSYQNAGNFFNDGNNLMFCDSLVYFFGWIVLVFRGIPCWINPFRI